ncbi:MAG: helix-turn-helix transcriptional regulator [Tissierellia bacterium]|nr:helix-turn-helix transcriptional regulator [Tissierellia bacterium]
MKYNFNEEWRCCNFHIKRAIEEMNNNYSESISLKDMADFLGLNKCYFCDLFKKETGKTYSQLLNEIRVEKSLDLLLNTNMTILEIALAVGYNNQNYYNMAFKKIMGTTPLKYRNAMKSSLALP